MDPASSFRDPLDYSSIGCRIPDTRPVTLISSHRICACTSSFAGVRMAAWESRPRTWSSPGSATSRHSSPLISTSKAGNLKALLEVLFNTFGLESRALVTPRLALPCLLLYLCLYNLTKRQESHHQLSCFSSRCLSSSCGFALLFNHPYALRATLTPLENEDSFTLQLNKVLSTDCSFLDILLVP